MGNNKQNVRPVFRGIRVGLLTFFLSLVFYLSSNLLMGQTNFIVSVIIILIIVFIGVLFDIVGVAVTAADEQPFHAMSAKKLPGSKQAINLIKNADRVSNFCNDIVGDICGTVSGAAGVAIVLQLTSQNAAFEFLANVLVVCLIAALTVGSKAYSKYYAIKDANQVIYKTGIVLWHLESKLKLSVFNNTGKKKRKRGKTFV